MRLSLPALAPRALSLLLLVVLLAPGGCRDAQPDAAATPESAPEPTTEPEPSATPSSPGATAPGAAPPPSGLPPAAASPGLDRVALVALLGALRGRPYVAPAAPVPAPLVALGPTALPDIGLAFEAPAPLVVLEHGPEGWIFAETTPAGAVEIRIGAARRDGLEAGVELMTRDFDAFVARWREQPGRVLDARLVPARGDTPAWARLARRTPEGERVDLALVVDGSRTMLVQLSGPGVAESTVLDALERSLVVFAPTERLDAHGVVTREDLGLALTLPPGWRREPERAIGAAVQAVGPLPPDGGAPPRASVRGSEQRVASLDDGFDALVGHLERSGGELYEMHRGRLRQVPAIRYVAADHGDDGRTLWRRGVLVRSLAGTLVIIERVEYAAELPDALPFDVLLSSVELDRNRF